ncbi:hypothetical protein D3C75_1277480 [compost metagenome]
MFQNGLRILKKAVKHLQKDDGANRAGNAADSQITDQCQIYGALPPMLEGAEQLGDGIVK